MARVAFRFSSVAMAESPESDATTAASGQAPVVNVHGYGRMPPSDILSLARGQDSYNRSVQRRVEMTKPQKAQIGAIGESRSLWYALRRHGTKAQCEEWLRILHGNSTWLDDRESDDEVLRRQYLHLWEAVRSFDSEFVDAEMRRRQGRAADGAGG